MTELDAIRAAHVESVGDDMCNECWVRWPCDTARALAEVDRLTLVAMDEGPYLDGQRHERARIAAAIEGLPAYLIEQWTPAAALMDGLPLKRVELAPSTVTLTRTGGKDGFVDRAAVLAAIEGAECQHRTWLTMDPPVCANCGKVAEHE